jgi:imidazolonepropionase
MTTDAILVRGARQLITLRGPGGPRRGNALRELGILQDGALLIRDGIIVDVGQGRRVENLADARTAREIDATGCVVMPGFVDSDVHLCAGPPRPEPHDPGGHEAAGARRASRLRAAVQAVRATPSRTLLTEARRQAAVFARHGTTTLEAKSGFGLDEGNETKVLRVFGRLAGAPLDVLPCYFGARATAPEYEDRPHEYIDWLIAEMLPLVARRRLARTVSITCGRGGFYPEDVRRYLTAARQSGFAVKLHAAHAPRHGSVRLGVEMGALSIDHLPDADYDEIAVLARSSSLVTLEPGAVFHEGHGDYAPARALIDHGAAVALATGFQPAASPAANMAMVLALACSQMRMTAAEAISAATINGAHAAGCAARTGSIEAGKQADLVIFDLADYREIPHYFGTNLVRTTIKNGRVIYHRGEVECPDG